MRLPDYLTGGTHRFKTCSARQAAYGRRRAAGDELNVEALVEGSVFRTGDRVRIAVQLIEAATDRRPRLSYPLLPCADSL